MKQNKMAELKETVKKHEEKNIDLYDSLIDVFDIGVQRIKDFVNLDTKTIAEMPKHVTDIKYKQAKIITDLIREQNVQKRNEEGMKIRIYHLSADDKPAFQKMITEGLPAYSPQMNND